MRENTHTQTREGWKKETTSATPIAINHRHKLTYSIMGLWKPTVKLYTYIWYYKCLVGMSYDKRDKNQHSPTENGRV